MAQEEVNKELPEQTAAEANDEERENTSTEKAEDTQAQQEEPAKKKQPKIVNDAYTVRITPDKTDDIKVFTVTRKMVRYAAASAVILGILVIGSLSFAGYSYIAGRADKDHIQQLQEANTLQQEQISDLSKKANALQENMDQLDNLEKELKQISGIETSDDNNSGDSSDGSGDSSDGVDESQNGQGGPYPQLPTLAQVRSTLDNIELKMNGKKNNMVELKKNLQTAIMMKRQQNAVATQTVSVTPSIWPARGVISSPFGLRWGGSDFHPGMDIANDIGTPIYATADGVVSVAGWNSGGYGNMVDIDHGNGVMTRYGHASYVVVTAGQHVKRGQIIAYMGSTGFSTGPHVHYEVRVNGQPVDPSGYIFN